VNGIGYHVSISLSGYDYFKKNPDSVIYTHLHIKEDSHSLYGFHEESEKALFLDLISISGIGPSTALAMLSAMNPKEIKSAIVAENVKQIQSVKGIGGKTAQRVILELKDKFKKEDLVVDGQVATVKDNTLKKEALSALLTLGYSKVSAEKVLDKLLAKAGENVTLEDLIKQALKSA
jgi:Holliday junction DNA helicase RuvA